MQFYVPHLLFAFLQCHTLHEQDGGEKTGSDGKEYDDENDGEKTGSDRKEDDDENDGKDNDGEKSGSLSTICNNNYDSETVACPCTP